MPVSRENFDEVEFGFYVNKNFFLVAKIEFFVHCPVFIFKIVIIERIGV
jgi:hypothetical protein